MLKQLENKVILFKKYLVLVVDYLNKQPPLNLIAIFICVFCVINFHFKLKNLYELTLLQKDAIFSQAAIIKKLVIRQTELEVTLQKQSINILSKNLKRGNYEHQRPAARQKRL